MKQQTNHLSWNALPEEDLSADDEGRRSDFVEHYLHQITEGIPYNTRILLVDDEAQNIKTLMAILEAGQSTEQLNEDLALLQQMFTVSEGQSKREKPQFAVLAVHTGGEAVELARRQESSGEPFALAFVDMRMPGGIDGLQTAEALRKISPDIEIVIMTAWSDYSLEQIRAVLGNNFAFMGKPFNQEDVSQRAVEGCAKWYRHQQSQRSQQALIQIAGKMEREIERRKKLESELKRAALYDQLTGLPNRGLFNDHLHHALAHTQRSGSYLLLMFIDLDHFKQVNDQHGHAVGDLLLKQVAEVLHQQIREEDVPCRWAGDEFSLLMAGFDHLDDVQMVGERLCSALNRRVELEGVELEMGASIGIACYVPDQKPCVGGSENDCLEDLAKRLLEQADQAMYKAKQSARGSFYLAPCDA